MSKLFVLFLLSSAGAWADDGITALQGQRAGILVLTLTRDLPADAELDLRARLAERAIALARVAPHLPVRSGSRWVNRNRDTVDARLERLAQDLVSKLRVAKTSPESSAEDRRRLAVTMIEDIAQIFTLTGANQGDESLTILSGMTQVIGYGALVMISGYYLSSSGVPAVHLAGVALTALPIPAAAVIFWPPLAGRGDVVLSAIGRIAPDETRGAVRATIGFWEAMDRALVAEPTLRHLVSDMHTGLNVVREIMAIGGGTVETCEAWLATPAPVTPALASL